MMSQHLNTQPNTFTMPVLLQLFLPLGAQTAEGVSGSMPEKGFPTSWRYCITLSRIPSFLSHFKHETSLQSPTELWKKKRIIFDRSARAYGNVKSGLRMQMFFHNYVCFHNDFLFHDSTGIQHKHAKSFTNTIVLIRFESIENCFFQLLATWYLFTYVTMQRQFLLQKVLNYCFFELPARSWFWWLLFSY